MKPTTMNRCGGILRPVAISAFVVLLAACGGESDRPNPAYGGSGGSAGPSGASGSAVAGDLPGVDFSGLGHVEGSASASIEVVEFSDFGCGYCRRFHLETYPVLYEEYVATGRVAWRYVPFVLGIFPNGEEAAHAGSCTVGRERFPQYRDRLFVDQETWRSADDPVAALIALAAEEGIDAGDLGRCIEEGARAEQVRRNTELGLRIGIRGTPAFVIEGLALQGAQPVEVFRQILDRLLASQPSFDSEEAS